MFDREYFLSRYRKIFIATSIITIMLFLLIGLICGILRIIDANNVANANSINYNNMTQAEMGDYSFISGNIEYVYDGFAKGYAYADSYAEPKKYNTGGKRSYNENHYYLIACPYSSDNTFMILVVNEYSDIATTIDTMSEKSSDENSIKGTYSIPFSGYLEKNDKDVVDFAYNTLKEQGMNNFTIAPYTINCNFQSGLADQWLASGIRTIVLVVGFSILCLFALLFGRGNLSVLGVSKGLGSPVGRSVEDYYGVTYQSNTEKSNESGIFYTDLSQYRSHLPQSGQAFQPEFQTQQSQSSQTFQTQQTQGNQNYQSQFGAQDDEQ